MQTSFFALIASMQAFSFKKMQNRIDGFRWLPENWDGYGAAVPGTDVLLNARRFLAIIAKDSLVLEHLEADNIVPTPYGTVVFDWHVGGEMVSVEIGRSTIGFFTDFKHVPNTVCDGVPFDGMRLPGDLKAVFQLLFEPEYA